MWSVRMKHPSKSLSVWVAWCSQKEENVEGKWPVHPVMLKTDENVEEVRSIWELVAEELSTEKEMVKQI